MSIGNSTTVDPPRDEPLSAPLNMQFDYTRSVGPTVGTFLTGLRHRRIIGGRGSDGRIHVPPPEYDAATAQPVTAFVEVAGTGTVTSWTWVPEPLPEHPLSRPFAWALITPDGADTGLLHAVDAGSPDAMSTGMRVRIEWAAQRVGSIHDIAYFVPDDGKLESPDTHSATIDSESVTMVVAPVDLQYQHSASHEESYYLRALARGRLLGGRTDPAGKVYIPPRGANPTDGRPTTEQVELPDKGTVTTFCIVNVPFLGQRITPPYVAAYILLDGADIAFLHLILECDPAEVRMGMRVEAVWRPREEWGYTLQNIDHFRPSGEPDAAYDTYRHHL